MGLESHYLSVEVIFNLLCVCRRGFNGTPRSVRAAILRRGLCSGSYSDLPRLPFWFNICRAASLLDESWPPYPTQFATDWFSYRLEKQIWTLVLAWLTVPRRRRQRALRERLLDKLLSRAQLRRSYQRELTGLRIIGICEGEQLSPFGWMVIGDRVEFPSYVSKSKLWTISNERLYVPYPPQWDLLWRLEAYLDPSNPGEYPLTLKSLRSAVTRGALDGLKESDLVAIIEKGLGKPPPSELVERMVNIPRLRVLPGPVLEFEDPQEMHQLRNSAFFRKQLQDVISPRHSHLDPWQAPTVLRRLCQQGFLSRRNLELAVAAHPAFQVRSAIFEQGENTMPLITSVNSLNRAESIYLLSLLLIAEGLKVAYVPPPGLLLKLVADLDSPSRAAAARKANDLLESISPDPQWVPEEEPPLEPEVELSAFLERVIAQEETIDVLYHAGGRKSPEYRHLTPLLVEQRGPRYYLVAYCHNRRANRTFRLDRLRLVDFSPEL